MICEIDLTPQPDPPSTTQIWIKRGGIFLKRYHKAILQSDAWLDDEIITTAQIYKSTSIHAGLQATSLGEKFAMVPQTGEFVQVLNVANNHWITISTIGCEDSTVNVYESLRGYLSSRTQRLVADLVQCRNRAIKLQYCDIQWKSGANDCGFLLWPLPHHYVAARTQQPPATIRGRCEATFLMDWSLAIYNHFRREVPDARFSDLQ